MIKYKNLFLAAICIAAGTLAIMTNLHKPSKNMVKSTTKLNSRYETESTINNMKDVNININNLNFSLNDNKNNLNQIVLNSEENVYGFKNIYTLASLPHKIVNMKNKINNINNKVQKNNIQMNYEIKKIRESFVANETISYSNSIRFVNESIIKPFNFTNLVSKYNSTNMYSEDNNKFDNTISNIRFISVIIAGVIATPAIGILITGLGMLKASDILYVIRNNSAENKNLSLSQVANLFRAIQIPSKENKKYVLFGKAEVPPVLEDIAAEDISKLSKYTTVIAKFKSYTIWNHMNDELLFRMWR